MSLPSLTCSPSSRTAAIGAGVAAGAWLLLLLAAPYLVSHAGAVSRGLGTLVYAAGAAVCHQRADRSFHAWGVQLPVCARCLGLYAAAAGGALFAIAASSADRCAGERGRAALPGTWRSRLFLGALPTAASVGLEAAGIWGQSPVIRCGAALPLGFAGGWFVAAHAGEVVGRLAHRSGADQAIVRPGQNGGPEPGRL